MTAPVVIGLDLSLTATGVAGPDGEHTLTTRLTGVERLDWFRYKIRELCGYHAPHLIAVEGYAFGRPNQATHLGELGGVVRLALRDAGVRWVDIPPASVKKYATGKGNAGKEEVLAAAIRRLGYGGHDNNQSDAMWLRAMGMHWLGHPVVELPKMHLDGMSKVAWPVEGVLL